MSDFQKGSMASWSPALTLVKDEYEIGGDSTWCSATVFKESDDSVIFKNVARIDVDGKNKLDSPRYYGG